KAARRGLLGAPGHVVRVAEPHRPRARRSRAPEPEQAVDGPAREPTLQVVQRSVDGRARGLLARRQRRFDLVEGEGVVAERHALEPVERGCRRLVVAVDRRGLAEAGDAVVRHLDLDDLGLVLRTARDHERLRQAQRGGACLQLHAVNLIGRSRCSRAYGYAAVSPRPVASTLPVFAGRDVVTDRVPSVASTFHGAPSLIHSDLRRPTRAGPAPSNSRARRSARATSRRRSGPRSSSRRNASAPHADGANGPPRARPASTAAFRRSDRSSRAATRRSQPPRRAPRRRGSAHAAGRRARSRRRGAAESPARAPEAGTAACTRSRRCRRPGRGTPSTRAGSSAGTAPPATTRSARSRARRGSARGSSSPPLPRAARRRGAGAPHGGCYRSRAFSPPEFARVIVAR